MTFRHGILTASALAVLGLGVYLLLAVRAPVEIAAAPAREPAMEPEPEPERARPRPGSEDSGRTTRARTPDRGVKLRDKPRPRETSAEPVAAPALAAASGTEIQQLDAIMAEANKAYDHGDFDEAKEIALRVLAQHPSNVRMLRIMVSASCIEGDSVEAQKHYLKLPAHDRAQMRTRCARYGVSFEES